MFRHKRPTIPYSIQNKKYVYNIRSNTCMQMAKNDKIRNKKKRYESFIRIVRRNDIACMGDQLQHADYCQPSTEISVGVRIKLLPPLSLFRLLFCRSSYPQKSLTKRLAIFASIYIKEYNDDEYIQRQKFSFPFSLFFLNTVHDPFVCNFG